MPTISKPLRAEQLRQMWKDIQQHGWDTPPVREEIRRQIVEAQHREMAMNIGSPTPGMAYGNSPQAPARATPSLYEMLAMRMRWYELGAPKGFEACNCYKRDEDVFVFVVPKQGEPLIITDDAALFPSDKLITQLRLLEG